MDEVLAIQLNDDARETARIHMCPRIEEKFTSLSLPRP